MRLLKPLAATLIVAGLALAGCSDDEPPAPSAAPSPPSPRATTASRPTTETTTTPTEENEGPVIVDPAEFTPPDGGNARLFKLADGVTECRMNNVGDAYLSCTTPLNDPPTVTDINGHQSVANSVSWNPSGVTYETLTYPPGTFTPPVLEPGQQLSDFGFTCTALSASKVECSGPQGTATVGDGQITGATIPEYQPAPSSDPKPAPPAPPADPGLPDLFGGGH